MEPIIDTQDYKLISKIFQENLQKVHAGYDGRFVNITDRRDASDRSLDKGYSKGEAMQWPHNHIILLFLFGFILFILRYIQECARPGFFERLIQAINQIIFS